MTTNQTIDGVPRDSVSQLVDFLADAKAYHKVVIGRCEDCIKSGESSEREEYGRIGYRTEKIEQVERLADELRALLDAPAVQWLAMEVNGKPWVIKEGPNAEKWRAMGYELFPAEPAAQPQGEPVYQIEYVGGYSGWRDVDESTFCDLKKDPRYKARIMYAHQPAPVAVVLPEREMYCQYLRGVIPENRLEVEAHKDGWNACLDELKRLNPSL